MPTPNLARRTTDGSGRPSRRARRHGRLTTAVIVGASILSACGGDDGGRGRAQASGVGRTFCTALEDLVVSANKAAVTESDATSLRADSQAILEVIPGGAPGEVATFFEALNEMILLSEVWTNPETGGIKEEYLDDFARLIEVSGGDPADVSQRYATSQCPSLFEDAGDAMARFFGGDGGRLPATPGAGPSSPSAPSGQGAEVRTVLTDGPSGAYEQVTFDIATVAASNADPAEASLDTPADAGASVLLVQIDAATDLSAPNQFSADDFRLTDPSGSTVTALSIIDRSGASVAFQLRGRDSARGIVVFPTDALVGDVSGYTVRIERDDRVPTLLPFGGPVATPYPVALEAGATGAFEASLTAACTDSYETSVSAADADLDADLGDPQGIERSARGQRWLRVALDVTNVSVQGPSTNDGVCHAFSGNFAGVELRLEADGRSTAPASEKSFDQIEPGSTAERALIFEVAADARELVLVGPAGEALGRWSVDLPAAPGEG